MQPTHEEKLATMRGEDTGWNYRFQVPGPSPNMWSHEDWIRYIGDNWFRVPRKDTNHEDRTPESTDPEAS
jgi:hypothetical protein